MHVLTLHNHFLNTLPVSTQVGSSINNLSSFLQSHVISLQFSTKKAGILFLAANSVCFLAAHFFANKWIKSSNSPQEKSFVPLLLRNIVVGAMTSLCNFLLSKLTGTNLASEWIATAVAAAMIAHCLLNLAKRTPQAHSDSSIHFNNQTKRKGDSIFNQPNSAELQSETTTAEEKKIEESFSISQNELPPLMQTLYQTEEALNPSHIPTEEYDKQPANKQSEAEALAEPPLSSSLALIVYPKKLPIFSKYQESPLSIVEEENNEEESKTPLYRFITPGSPPQTSIQKCSPLVSPGASTIPEWLSKMIETEKARSNPDSPPSLAIVLSPPSKKV